MSIVAEPVAIAGLRVEVATRHLVIAAVVLLYAPAVVFAAALEPLPRLVLLIGLVLVAAVFAMPSWRPAGPTLNAPVAWRDLAACCAAAVALSILGGQAHFVFSTWDWLIRGALLADLVRDGFPVAYRMHGEDYLLRAPVGMSLIPALIGRATSLTGAHYALLVQNILLLSVVLYLTTRLMRDPRPGIVAALLLFGPMDIIPRVVTDLIAARASGTFVLSPLTMFWNQLVPVWGLLPSLFWAPNHALPGWLFAVSFLLYLRRDLHAAHCGVVFAGLLLWSPLAAIGAIPFLAYAVWRDLMERGVTARDLTAAAAAAGMVPVAIYLQMDAGQLSKGWAVAHAQFWFWYGLLLVFVTGPAWLLLSVYRDIPAWRRPALVIALLCVLLMPLYRFGTADTDNDMTLRCTIVPMFLIAVAFADQLEHFTGWMRARLAMVFLVVGAMTGAMELRRALVDPVQPISDCNLLTVHGKVTPGVTPVNYLARRAHVVPGLLHTLPSHVNALEARVCWPGYPLLKGQ